MNSVICLYYRATMATDERVLKLKIVDDVSLAAEEDVIVTIQAVHAQHSKMLAGLMSDLGDNAFKDPIEILCSADAVRTCVAYCETLHANGGKTAKYENAHMTNIHVHLADSTHADAFDVLPWEKEFINQYNLIDNTPIDISRLDAYSKPLPSDTPTWMKLNKFIPDVIRNELVELDAHDESKLLSLKDISYAAQYLQLDAFVMLIGWRGMEIIKEKTAKYDTGEDQDLELFNLARHTIANLLRVPLAAREFDESEWKVKIDALVWVERVYNKQVEPPMPDESAIHAENYTHMPPMPPIPTIDDMPDATAAPMAVVAQ